MPGSRPAGRSRLRRRRRRRRRSDPGCRMLRRKRAKAHSRAHRLHGSNPAFPAPHGSEFRPGNENCLNSRRMPSASCAICRIDLGVGAFEIGVGHHAPARHARARRYRSCSGRTCLDDPVQMDIDEIQTRRRAPVSEQTRLDMLELQRFAQQRIVEKIDLPDRKIVCGTPISVTRRDNSCRLNTSAFPFSDAASRVGLDLPWKGSRTPTRGDARRARLALGFYRMMPNEITRRYCATFLTLGRSLAHMGQYSAT